MKKKIIGLCLLLVFSTQLMPVMQLGLILANAQLTEEQCSTHEDNPKGKESTLHVQLADVRIHPLSKKQHCLLSQNENIHSRQADDIQKPPPNMQ